MEKFPNINHQEVEPSKDEAVLNDNSREMFIESLKITLANRDTDNVKNDPTSSLTDEYYDEVEKTLKEIDGSH